MMSSSHAGVARGESGFTLIDMLFVIALIGLLSTLAIPGLMRARGAAQSASALGTLKVINSAQLSFAITCGLGFYSPDLQTLGVRPPAAIDAFLTPEMSTGPTFIKSGYNFSMAGVGIAGAPASCNGLAAGAASSGYAAVADPLDLSPPARHFGTNADGTIYEDTGTYGATMPETGAPPSGAPLK
jgi:type IV pilus assembly protein PilA